MSGLSREREAFQTALSVPGVPDSVPSFREGVPARSLVRSQFAPPRSQFPSLGGNGERARLGRRPQLRVHRCGEWVLVGLDDEPAGLTAWCDQYPISQAGEVAALTAGRWTWSISHGRLERRNRWTIPGHPPAPDLLVIAEHRCDSPLPDDWLAPPTPRPPAPTHKEPF